MIVSKTSLKNTVFLLFAYRNHVLQHAENCVNTSVFARRWPNKQCKYNVNTVIYLSYQRGKHLVNSVASGFQGRKHNPCDDFWGTLKFKMQQSVFRDFITLFGLFLLLWVSLSFPCSTNLVWTCAANINSSWQQGVCEALQQYIILIPTPIYIMYCNNKSAIYI